MSPETPMVTVVIPTYRRPKFLSRAIDSVCRQTYGNIEIIVVDDNEPSSAESREVADLMRGYADRHVKLLLNNRKHGGAGARNTGIYAASGKYIAFLDDDDEYLPDKISDSVAYFESTNDERLALVYGFAVMRYGVNRSIISKSVYEGMPIEDLFVRGGLVATSQMVCTRKALIDIGGFPIAAAKQDTRLLVELFRHGYTMACIAKPHSIYHDYEGMRISYSNASIIGEQELLNVAKEFWPQFDSKTKIDILLSYNRRLAIKHFAMGNYIRFASYSIRYLKMNKMSDSQQLVVSILQLFKKKLTKSIRKIIR